jgi:hypothetical protein
MSILQALLQIILSLIFAFIVFKVAYRPNQ